MGRAVSMVGAVFALVCLVLVLLVVPAGAQDGGIRPGTAADGSNPENPSDNPTIITIAARGCTVAAGASITLEDGDGTRAIFIDGERGITIISQDGRPRMGAGPARPRSSGLERWGLAWPSALWQRAWGWSSLTRPRISPVGLRNGWLA